LFDAEKSLQPLVKAQKGDILNKEPGEAVWLSVKKESGN
jgi:hypothetical protein